MWLDEGEQSLWRRAARLLLAPASWLYAAGTLLRGELYARGALPRKALPIRVVSTGSLVRDCASGALTASWIASALQRRGHRVALAASGAGGARARRDSVLVVSDGRYVKSRFEIAGASAMILAAHSPGVPVLVGGDPFHVGVRAVAAFDSEILVLDGGFQHHPLLRDLDVVALDSLSKSVSRALWPRGPRREPVRALQRADAVGVIDGPLDAHEADALERFGSEVFRFVAERKPIGVRPLQGGAMEPAGVLDGAAVGLISSLARPTFLRHTIERLGASVVTERNFRDHHRYGPRDMRYLYRNAPLWVTTERDAIRINPDWIGRADVRVLSIKLEVSRQALLVDWLEERLGIPIANAARAEVARAGVA